MLLPPMSMYEVEVVVVMKLVAVEPVPELWTGTETEAGEPVVVVAVVVTEFVVVADTVVVVGAEVATIAGPVFGRTPAGGGGISSVARTCAVAVEASAVPTARRRERRILN